MDKLDMHSRDLTQQNIERLAEVFPMVVTEQITDEGKLVHAVNFDQLRQELSDHVVDGPRERYQLEWPGKRAALFAANAPIRKTLRPDRDKSIDYGTTKNVFIQGDNLDTLKLLQESYLNKVKLIYIDPPYNTGNDFIYDDKFADSTSTYLAKSGQVDDTGARLVANSESNGRFHSDWLSMMYPRLKLARNLLTQDGILLVSINDLEVANLRKMLDEIFGETNFVAQFVWVNEGNVDQQSKIKGVHEYIVAFARAIDRFEPPTVIDPNIEENSKLFRDLIENSITKNGPANPPSTVVLPKGFPTSFPEGRISARDDQYPHVLDEIVVKDGRLLTPTRVRSGWSSRNLLDLFINNGCARIQDSKGRETWFELRETGAIYGIKKRADDQGHVLSVLRNMGTTKQNSSALSKWGLKFSYPKPVFLIEYLIRIFTESDESAIVLDFFSGSGTTAHAVMAANARDGGDRRHIQVQLAEPAATGGDSAEDDNIAQLCRQRIAAAGKHIMSEFPGADNSILDIGFRAFRVDSTNMASVLTAPDDADQDQLGLQADNLKPGRSSEDILFEVMLDWGLELDLQLENMKIGDYEVLIVEGGALIACFDLNLDADLVRSIAEAQPLRAVFRDAGFTTDADRINAEQIFAEISSATDVKVI